MFRRILALVAVAGLTAALGVLVKFPTLKVGDSRTPQTVSVQPKQPTLVCPGPVFVNGGQNGVTLGSFAHSGSVAIAGIESENIISFTSFSEKVFKGSTTGSQSFNAIQTQFANGKQAYGLASANCVPGSNDAWLVAGDNSVGREALLILANPTSVDSTVSLQLYGTSGPIQGTGLSGISAPAGKVTVLALSSFAPKAETFSVHVSSRGAELGIWLQQKTVRGLTPGGLDLVGATALPAKVIDIPGVFIRNTTALANLANDSNFQDVKPILRVTAPGEKDAKFTAQVQGADGSSFGTVIQGEVPAGSTRDFVLEDIAEGNYSVHIEADVELLGAVRYSRMSGSLPDFAWAQAVEAKKLLAGFSAPAGATSKLSIVNSNSEATVVLINGKSSPVAANSNVVVSLAAGYQYLVKSKLPVSISQVIDVKGGLAVAPVIDYQTLGGKLKVSVR